MRRNERLPWISREALFIMRQIEEENADVETALRGAFIDAAKRRQLSKWCKEAGITTPTASMFANDIDYHMNVYTINRFLAVKGLRLTIEVNA